MRRGQIIKQAIIDKCIERGIEGYTNLSSSDVSEILDSLYEEGVILNTEEMTNLGFEDSYRPLN